MSSPSSKKQAKPTARAYAGTAMVSEDRLMRDRALSGRTLQEDMAAYRKAVSATPESAREFLTHLGVITRSCKPKKLIRG